MDSNASSTEGTSHSPNTLTAPSWRACAIEVAVVSVLLELRRLAISYRSLVCAPVSPGTARSPQLLHPLEPLPPVLPEVVVPSEGEESYPHWLPVELEAEVPAEPSVGVAEPVGLLPEHTPVPVAGPEAVE